MPPFLATLVFAIGILLLFRLDRGNGTRVSPALWIPTAWVLIAGSRMLSEWQVGAGIESPDQYFEGSPLDRLVLTGLLAAALCVLLARARRTETFLRWNTPIVLFFVYCGLSVLWSDYPDVAFKRWTKALGDLLMVMVVLTEADPLAAVKRLLSRAAFLLIPLSVLLIKYYPEWGRGYDPWTWTPYYGGVAIGKNSLGYVCLIFGLASLWRFLSTFGDPDRVHRQRWRIAHGVVLLMTLWLFWQAGSATSFACFFLGGALLAVTTIPGFARTTATPHFVLGLMACVAFTVLFLNADGSLVQAMGRDSTLTGRTELWSTLGRMIVDPLLGTGFESFWLGERVSRLWSVYWWHPRQAHNGYLEVLLNLGWFGIALIALVLAWGYRNISADFRWNPEAARLRLAFLIVALVYNVTEAAFKMMHPVWIALLVAVAVPVRTRVRT
jgi:exopolysaccharide production protein ExoQ